MALIDTRNLFKIYKLGDVEVRALNDVSVSVERGEFVAVMGPSGSGKSTFMNILGCLDKPTSGTYLLDGIDVTATELSKLAGVRNRKIGFVFQGFQLLPRLTAVENVALPLLLCGMPVARRLERASGLLRQVGLGDRLHHRPSQLSGGQQQRVAIARALARDPAVLLADEPTGNLDAAATGEVLALLEALNRQGRTVVLITHDGQVARRAGRQLCISGGRLTESPRL